MHNKDKNDIVAKTDIAENYFMFYINIANIINIFLLSKFSPLN